MNQKATLLTFVLLASIIVPPLVSAQSENGPSVLIVTAHPDDEAMFAGAVYKITHELHGRVDLALITDGAGGYRFSTFAEPIYGLKLTDPAVAAEYLPAIRKQELMRGGRIVGIANYFFFDQPDRGKTYDPEEFLDHDWDTTYVENRLEKIMREGDYDFAFVHLPVASMHAHHKAATILALKAASKLDDEVRPVVLGGWSHVKGDTTTFHFDHLDGYDITKVEPEPYKFDRDQPVGLDGRLNYNIVVNWLVAEHKSQGTMQTYLSQGKTELYYYFVSNNGLGREKAKALFERLGVPPPAPSATH
ncbi:MAG: PIG-L family deacetylase [Rhodothermales bacterium]